MLMEAEFPIAHEYAEMLDAYHYFLVQQHPRRLKERRPIPFPLERRGTKWVEEEKRRLRTVWATAWEGRLADNLFALSYWAVAHYDGLRAATWLLEVFRHLPNPDMHSGTMSSLSDILAAYVPAIPQSAEAPIDLYVALDQASRAIELELGGESPLDVVNAYRPRPLW